MANLPPSRRSVSMILRQLREIKKDGWLVPGTSNIKLAADNENDDSGAASRAKFNASSLRSLRVIFPPRNFARPTNPPEAPGQLAVVARLLLAPEYLGQIDQGGR